jgi:hypothetical protein
MAEAKPNPIQAVFTPTKGVQLFFGGKSRMWITRLRHNDPRFPTPVYFGKAPHWRISDLEKYAAEAPTTPTPGVVSWPK